MPLGGAFITYVRRIVLVVASGLLLSGTAYAQCTSPSAAAGAREWFGTGPDYRFCNGTNWVDVHKTQMLGACAVSSQMEYDGTLDSYRFCDGSNWRKAGCMPVITNGLAAYWRLNEASGNSAADSSGSGNTGTITGPGWQSPGYTGTALNFDGADDFVDAGSAGALDDIGPHSVAAWIYPRTHGENNHGWIVGKATGTDLPTNGWRLGLTNDVTRAVTFSVHHNTSHLEYVSGTNAITFNTWNHVLVTWDGTTGAGSTKIYVNGTEVGSYSYIDTGSGARLSDAANSLYIGANPAGDRTFDGYIDEIRIYNRALSGTEAATLAGDVPVICCMPGPAPSPCAAAPTEVTATGLSTYNVPANCNRLTIQAFGAGGGGTSNDIGGGGGGGGGGSGGGGGGGGGFAQTFSTVTPGEVLDIYVGGGGSGVTSTTGGTGGALGGGSGGPPGGMGSAGGTYGGGGGGGQSAMGGGGTYGGGGGGGISAGGGSSTHGGGGAAGQNGTVGSSSTGLAGSPNHVRSGGGGGGLGDIIVQGVRSHGTAGGDAANGGPGGGGASGASGSNGKVVLIPSHNTDVLTGACPGTAQVFNTPGQFVFTVPAGCSSATVQVYGAGGGGASSGGGAGGGGGSIIERSNGTDIVIAGGGGGAGGGGSGGGGGAYASSVISVSSGENLRVSVGGGGPATTTSNGSAGGAYNGGFNGMASGSAGGTSVYGGGGGGGQSGGQGGNGTYGGGGGGGSGGSQAGSGTYGGGGGGGTGGSGGGSSTYGNAGGTSTTRFGGGGGGMGTTVINGSNGSGTTGGAAANSGPGSGGNSGLSGGNGRVVITTLANDGCIGYGACAAEGTVEYQSTTNMMVWCDGTEWRPFAVP